MSSGRVVVWLGEGVGKGFSLPAVIVVGAVVGIGLAVGSFFVGKEAEKKKCKAEEELESV